jgi:hypothetical protein
MTSPDPRDGQQAAGGSGPDRAAADPGPEPVLPRQSREDTDLGWGDYQEAADDRLYRDRPPHWDDF